MYVGTLQILYYFQLFLLLSSHLSRKLLALFSLTNCITPSNCRLSNKAERTRSESHKLKFLTLTSTLIYDSTAIAIFISPFTGAISLRVPSLLPTLFYSHLFRNKRWAIPYPQSNPTSTSWAIFPFPFIQFINFFNSHSSRAANSPTRNHSNNGSQKENSSLTSHNHQIRHFPASRHLKTSEPCATYAKCVLEFVVTLQNVL